MRRSLRTLTQMLRQKPPTDAAGWYDLARAQRKRGKLPDAVTSLCQAVLHRPDNMTLYMKIARAFERLGELSSATTTAESAAELYPQAADPDVMLGRLLPQVGQARAGAAHLRRAIALAPERAPQLQVQLASLLLELHEPQEAERAAQAALALNQRDAQAMLVLSRALQAQQRMSEALVTIGHAMALAPEDMGIRTQRGLLLVSSGHVDAGVEELTQIVRASPQSPEALVNLGMALHEGGRADEALPHLRQAIALQPSSPIAHCNHGISLGALGRIDEAIAAFRTALAFAPDWPVAHLNLAQGLRHSGHLVEAKASLERALALAEGDAEIEAALKDVSEELARGAKQVQSEQDADPIAHVFSGDLKRFAAADVMEFLRLNRQSGILRFEGAEGGSQTGITVYLASGKVVGANAAAVGRLTDLLQQSGAVDAERLDGMRRQQEVDPDFVLAAKLLQDKAIAQQPLRDALRQQITAALTELLAWTTGTFTFVPSDTSQEHPIVDGRRHSNPADAIIAFATEELVLDALRDLDEQRGCGTSSADTPTSADSDELNEWGDWE